jgi:DNA-directed RNA polymerase specialized sigma24 family protein
MKMQFEEWDDSFLDLEDYQVERALTNAALDAIRRARRFGTRYVIWEDERVKSLAPDETAPHEHRLLENVERLNRKIAELQAQDPNALELNERAEKPKDR